MKASTANAMEMNKAKISSDDLKITVKALVYKEDRGTNTAGIHSTRIRIRILIVPVQVYMDICLTVHSEK